MTCTRSKIQDCHGKSSIQQEEGSFTSKLDVNLRNKLGKRSTVVCGAENTTVRTVDQKYLESFEMWRWRRIQKITWIDCVRNEEMLCRVKVKRNILQTVKKRRNANWVGDICVGTCLLKTRYGRKGRSDGKMRTEI
jgi:hypothetical protein